MAKKLIKFNKGLAKVVLSFARTERELAISDFCGLFAVALYGKTGKDKDKISRKRVMEILNLVRDEE